MKHIEKLQEVIRQLHACEAAHLMTIPVTETFEDRTTWEGEVELFHLHGHPKAIACYAWSFLDDANVEQFSAVLKISPIVSANAAVREDIVMRLKSANSKTEGWNA